MAEVVRVTEANTLEREVEQALRSMVRRHGGYCLKWVSPGNSGVPDRIILLPRGGIIFAETKKPKGGRPSALQIVWSDRLAALGFSHRFIYSKQDVFELETEIERRERH